MISIFLYWIPFGSKFRSLNGISEPFTDLDILRLIHLSCPHGKTRVLPVISAIFFNKELEFYLEFPPVLPRGCVRTIVHIFLFFCIELLCLEKMVYKQCTMCAYNSSWIESIKQILELL